MSGCSDLRRTWEDLVGKTQAEAVRVIQSDGTKKLDIVMDGTPESFAVIKSGYVRIILDEHGRVKYPPLLQD